MSSYGIENSSDYYYIVWELRNRVTATQPYTLTHSIDLSDTAGDVSLVGIKIHDGSYSTSYTSPVLKVSKGVIYSYILTKHPKSQHPRNLSYTINADSTTVHKPVDDPDNKTTLTSSDNYNYSPPKPVYPIGSFNFWKYNSYRDEYNTNTVNYQLSEFVSNEIDSISSKMYFHMYTIGYPYPWTIGEGYTSADIEGYGKKKVTYVLTDDEFYFNDSVTPEAVPAGTEQLDVNDYDILKLQYSLGFKGAAWNTDKLKFVETDPVYTPDDKVYFYAKFGSDENWSEIGVYHADTGVREITDTARVKSWDDDTIVFQDNAGCVGYRIVSSNSFYYTRIDARPYCRIKHSQRIDSLIAAQFDSNVKRSWLTNRANTKIYANDTQEISNSNLVFSKTRVASDYLVGYERETRFEKTNTYSRNDKVKHIVTIGWSAELSESYMTQSGREYVPQSSGTFYDLLPSGATIDTESVAVKANDEYLRDSRYEVTAVANYRDTGRTLLIVKIFGSTDDRYILTYSTLHSWESIIDFGSEIHNTLAYETGNESITGGFPDSGGRITDSSLMEELDPDTDGNKFVYTEHNVLINILVAAFSGLNKSVKNDISSEFGREDVVSLNDTYQYKLRYANSYINESKNIVLYDSLES